MKKESFIDEKHKSLKLSNIKFDEEIKTYDDFIEPPSDENYDGNQVTITINKRYIKPYFFKILLGKHNDISESECNYENEQEIDSEEFNIVNIKEENYCNPTDSNSNRLKQGYSKRSENNKVKIKKANKNWSIILNTIFLINRMRNVQVKRIKTKELEEHYDKWFLGQPVLEKINSNNSLITMKNIKDCTTKASIKINCKQQYKWKNDEENTQLEYIAKQARFFNLIASGLDENYLEIVDLVNNDPNKFIFNTSQKNKYFVNKKNEEFLNPLYIATINGHLKIVKLMCENGADNLIKNGKFNEGESVLDACVRWKMVNILKYYLDTFNWPKIYLENAIVVAEEMKNIQMKKQLNFFLKKHKDKKKCRCIL